MNDKTIDRKHEVFFCISIEGYMTKINPKSHAEKQAMRITYSHYIQLGFRGKDNIKLIFFDHSERTVNPSNLRMNEIQYLSRKRIHSFWLERKIGEDMKHEQQNNRTEVLQEAGI